MSIVNQVDSLAKILEGLPKTPKPQPPRESEESEALALVEENFDREEVIEDSASPILHESAPAEEITTAPSIEEAPSETAAPEAEPTTSGSGSGFKSDSFRELSARVLVEKGDRMQQQGLGMLFEYRASGNVETARADRNKLIRKLETDGQLSEADRQLLAYANQFIENYEARLESFKKNTPLSQDDKAALIEIASSYFKETGSEPHPIVLILMIVLGSLAFNAWTAWQQPEYNPPRNGNGKK